MRVLGAASWGPLLCIWAEKSEPTVVYQSLQFGGSQSCTHPWSPGQRVQSLKCGHMIGMETCQSVARVVPRTQGGRMWSGKSQRMPHDGGAGPGFGSGLGLRKDARVPGWGAWWRRGRKRCRLITGSETWLLKPAWFLHFWHFSVDFLFVLL